MKASDLLQRPASLHRRAIPSLVAIDRSVGRILAQWPDVVLEPAARDREALARQLLTCVTEWSWGRMKTARVLSAALAVFDEERRDRPDLEPARAFLIAEIGATNSASFLSGMAQVYLETFDAAARHTRALAGALARRATDLKGRIGLLLASMPDLFTPDAVPRSLARRMLAAEDPYVTVKALGFRAPHGSGLTRAAHRQFVESLAPSLRESDARRRLLAWIMPSSGAPLQSDAGLAVEALLRAWADVAPPDDVRNEITEALLSAYNDPRTHNGGIWSGFDQGLKAVFLRWLTKQDMLFFCDMVTATQPNHMWPPRRNFWLRLYEDGRIDEAWVAFGSAARDYARRRLLNSGTTDINRRFGRQTDRGGSTSLLRAGQLRNEALDAPQLVKHAFGLRTAVHRDGGPFQGLTPVLVYLYAEPRSWPDGRPVDAARTTAHRAEVEDLSNRVARDEVRLAAVDYARLVKEWIASDDPDLALHARRLCSAFDINLS